MSTKPRLISHVALPAPARDALVDSLNKQLATAVDLYTQVKQAHWNVKGLQFIALHELFDEKATRLLGWVDQIAERTATLGGIAMGTARMAAAGSSLPEYDAGALDGKAHLSALVKRYTVFTGKLREAIEHADEQQDPATADLLTQVLGGAEMDMWFFESHLNV